MLNSIGRVANISRPLSLFLKGAKHLLKAYIDKTTVSHFPKGLFMFQNNQSSKLLIKTSTLTPGRQGPFITKLFVFMA